MEAGRNYYQILSSIFSIIFGIIGLVLGYFYYKDKKNFENNNLKNQSIRQRLELLLEELDKYDSNVLSIINNLCRDDHELTLARTLIKSSNEKIVVMLELNHILFELSNDEIKDILAIHSFIDNNVLIMEQTIEKLNKNNLDENRDVYLDLIRKARKICYCKVV